MIEGWMGKLKGLEQVLWERGWIDEKIYDLVGNEDPAEVI